MAPQTDSAGGGSRRRGPAVVYFAKAPVPGRVKTRLTPPLTPAEAAGLYRAFLIDAVVPISGARTLVYGWPAAELAVLRGCVPASIEVRPQRGDDLFARVEACFDELFAEGHAPVVVRNTDSPDLPVERVEEAIVRCAPASVVLGPDQGGGYYLVALGGRCPGLFSGHGEGGPDVLAQTAARARAQGLRVELLAPAPDVDTFEDLLALWRRRPGPREA